MRNKLKSVLRLLPLPLRKIGVYLYESTFLLYSRILELREYGRLPSAFKIRRPIRNILIYHISGMSFGGTEKNLQVIADALAADYNVIYMYSDIGVPHSRSASADPRITKMEFSYDRRAPVFPYFIHGMTPHFKQIISKHDIDLIITADSGHSQYPFNTVRDIPIMLINIFGAPALQKNIKHTVYISNEVRERAEFYTGKKPGSVMYIPSHDPDPSFRQSGIDLRRQLGIPDSDFVFGRIGRADDGIFDPIAIKAFKQVVRKHPTAHFLIMSPMPILKKIVEEESIPNVHFLPPSSKESDIWGFHHAIDCLAHFRNDGESCGLNIGESMLAGNPVISHRTHLWNAHTEYLRPEFSRIADQNDTESYAGFMEEYIRTRTQTPDTWERMRHASRQAGIENFGIEPYTSRIQSIISSL